MLGADIGYDEPIISSVDFTIQGGDRIGIIGENGAGKSTLIKTMTKEIKPLGGRVVVHPKIKIGYFEQEQTGLENDAVIYDVIQKLMPEESQTQIRKHLAKFLFKREDVYKKVGVLSGGEKVRLIFAMFVLKRYDLIIMDEPTTALDVVVQREILQKIYALKEEFGFSILFITHDLSLMVEFSDRIGIMYSGELIEVAPSKEILTSPYHPYTKGLGSSFPPLTGPKTKLTGIPGNPLNLLEIPQGCRFQARCDRVHEACTRVPTQLRQIEPGRLSNCHLYGEPIAQAKV